MGKRVFVKFVSEPKNDQIKSIVGIACASQAINDGHEVIVQESAGVKSGFSNDEYTKFGARIVGTLDEVYQQSDMIVKVKEPQEAELSKIRE